MIDLISGDIFTQSFDILVNPVNCVGVMGSGLALEFKRRYPKMFDSYKYECLTGKLKPGKLHIWKTSQCQIINLPTKNHWRDPSTYAYIENGLKVLQEYLTQQGYVTVAIPALGCGLGGLEWPKVYDLIILYLANMSVKISVFGPQMK